MGYSLRIGEAKIEFDEDYVRIGCDVVSSKNAPAFGEPTDYESQRWPSYSSWANAMTSLGMQDLMFNLQNKGAGEFIFGGKSRQPLIQEHPGAAPITLEHVEFAETKLSDYKMLHPTHIAQYPPPRPGAKPIFGNDYRDEDLDNNPIYDGNLCRGEWLVFWLRWAYENCKQPVFVNS